MCKECLLENNDVDDLLEQYKKQKRENKARRNRRRNRRLV